MKRDKTKKIIGICLVILVAGVFTGAVARGEFPNFGSFPEREIKTSAQEGLTENINESESIGKPILIRAPEESGGSNIVADVLWDYRGYDTLGEATVLFAAVTGIALIFRSLKERDE